MKSNTLTLIVLAYCSAVGASALEAGVSSCDITPDVRAFRVPLAGYGAREGKPAEGVHDPLHAKVLFLRDGDRRAVLITTDLRSITPEFKQQVIHKAAGLGLSEDNVFVCASHTHAGPAMYPQPFWQKQFGVYDPAIVEAMSDAVARALTEAESSAAPVRTGTGEAVVEGFTRNRRWSYDTAAREAAGEKPLTHPRLWVLRVDDRDGACRALLVNFAVHPTIGGADNMLVSAEWPGVLQREIEKAFPGAVALYTNGAEGDQAPQGAQGADAFARMHDFGSRLAAEAIAVARGIETAPGVPIGIIRVTPLLPEITFSPAARTGPYGALMKLALDALPRRAEIQLLRIGDTVLAGLPGEPLCAVGLATEEAVRDAGFKEAIVAGLANDYIGYIVNEAEYAHGGYEVDMRSYYGKGLGAFCAAQAGEAAAALRGKR